MKTNYRNFVLNVLNLSVQSALVAMFTIPTIAFAETDDEAVILTNPTNYVELGAENIPNKSAKFGEYNGLKKPGLDLIGNFNFLGGNSYGQGSGTNRWSITGIDIGTTSRELGATASNQGSWDVGIKLDELRHNISDSYQTALQGAMGGNNFTLPGTFGVINITNPTTANTTNPPKYGAQTLSDTQIKSLNTQDVHSDRMNSTITARYIFNPEWSANFDYNHLDQSGAKLISSGSNQNFNNSTSAAIFTLDGTTRYLSKGQGIQVLMNPTNYKTDSGNFALNWIGDNSHLTGSYNFSLFRDANNGLNFSNPFVSATTSSAITVAGAGFPINTLSTAPDNDFHQLNLTGGYAISKDTKLVGGLSYGRNTQNDAYVNQNQMTSLPKSSFDGLVLTTHADLKLTNQTTKNLMLSAGLKYNERDNQSASNPYTFYEIGGGSPVTAFNIPMSNKKTQFDVAGDYRIDTKQKLHFGYEYEQINRWCNSSPSLSAIVAATPGPGGASNGAATSYYNGGSSCVQVPESRESRMLANYRIAASEDLSLTAGYTYARRLADVNASFYNPMQSYKEGYELPGYVAFFDASRTENLLKAGLNWQATEKLSVGINGRYVHDNYDSKLGVQSGHTYSFNLDTTYNVAEKTVISAYLSVQNRQRNLLNDAWSHVTVDFPNTSAQSWTNSLSSDDKTFGLNAKHGGLLGGKLDIVGDLTYSLSTSSYATTVNYPLPTCTAPSTGGYTCGALPDIRSEMIQLKLAGNYRVDKSNKVLVGYLYQHLNSNDYYYNAYQTGYTPTSLMPTNQQAPSYSQNVLYAAYVYEFR